ncbi:signal peptidase I [Candidatus Roizmanbacteria bacterium CG_4_10_14_0_8_um_filter_33_9]|uniref:Signal peptidase I n=1 Tax=Candidatus Roizmanbacteria bacterium CG_4_10_14_0_8_um_filter_33_9 TaxID=1974826 RepID=A0A2M7QII7_9BACT|nr:MAG: signal peptidase I [Candidatus Roizmanbacteria bacterium CG_4_10_14_0_8_um_filter_33_9]
MKIVKGIIEFVMDILETVVFIGSLFIVVYLFVMQPNQVKGASMDPTFNTGNYIFTSKVTYKLRSVHRGDVVVFKSPKNPDIEYIKRIIALPKDTIEVRDSEVYINNIKLTEPYIAAKTNVWEGGFTKNGEPFTIPDGEIFVMGDNRPRSSDSREFGPVPISSIIGQVFYRYFPANKIGIIPNPFPAKLQE